ncbi:hypothetical protein DFH28DRAFT_1104153 [Melampsora americana]|nr:hypothetical protein DFH28DRAFT_1104153 [Melampsora americana]
MFTSSAEGGFSVLFQHDDLCGVERSFRFSKRPESLNRKMFRKNHSKIEEVFGVACNPAVGGVGQPLTPNPRTAFSPRGKLQAKYRIKIIASSIPKKAQNKMDGSHQFTANVNFISFDQFDHKEDLHDTNQTNGSRVPNKGNNFHGKKRSYGASGLGVTDANFFKQGWGFMDGIFLIYFISNGLIVRRSKEPKDFVNVVRGQRELCTMKGWVELVVENFR